MGLRRASLGCPMVLLLSLIACDRRQPFEPAIHAAATGAGAALKAPSNTKAVPVSESRIDVSWTDNSTNETGFEVHRSVSGPAGTFTLRVTTDANISSYGDAGLNAATPYCYRVRASRVADGRTRYSHFSTVACATPPAPPPPAAPSRLDAKPTSSRSIELTWFDNSTDESGFRVERSLDLGATWSSLGTVGANVYYNHDVGLASEQHVCYRVIAFNGPSESGPSNMDCTTPPAGPTALTAIALDETWSQIELAWTDNSAVEDGYVVWFYWVWEDGSIFWETIGVPANSTRLVTSNLGCEYYVVAWKDGGSSDRSNYVRTPASSAACF